MLTSSTSREIVSSHAQMTVVVFSHSVSAFLRVLVWTGKRCENSSVDAKLLKRFRSENALLWTEPLC